MIHLNKTEYREELLMTRYYIESEDSLTLAKTGKGCRCVCFAAISVQLAAISRQIRDEMKLTTKQHLVTLAFVLQLSTYA